jgi:cobalt-zinc-cadmium efflux system membrane fusion protein
MPPTKVVVIVAAVCAFLLAAVVSVFIVPSLRVLAGLEARAGAEEYEGARTPAGAKVIHDADKRPGLALTKAAIYGLSIKPVRVQRAVKARPLPPQVGTINFDNDTLFPIPCRFPGEIAEIAEVYDPSEPNYSSAKKPFMRPLRYGDRVKQKQMLCVVHSVALGTAKAALVDAVCSLALSTETLERHYKLFTEGSISLATLRLSERQKQADSNTVLTAERTLLTMKLSQLEVQEVKDEAKKIAELAKDNSFKRDAKSEAERWAKVVVTVPEFDKENPDRELVVVEKNKNLYAMIDPIATGTPLFQLADLKRVQIWVHPAEEYLPTFRKMLDNSEPGGPFWTVSIPSYPDDKLPPIRFSQIAPSLEPFQHAPMLMGYLNNPNGNKYVIGQFVTATIDLPPEPDTLEVPTEAINEIGGEALVFLQPDPKKDEFILRRVAIVQRFRDVTLVRMKLTNVELEENQRNAKLENPKRTIEPLAEGALVVTRGVVELTAALEDLLMKEKK